MLIRPMLVEEVDQVSNLVMAGFNNFIAPEYSAEGCAEFAKYANSDAILERVGKISFLLLAYKEEQVVGMIEIRDQNHIALFYVEKHLHRQGIGKQLMAEALKYCQEKNPALATITVNSSPYAVSIYERMGFRKTESEQEKNGIRFTPMELTLN